jgi:hypothetical protein
LEDGRGQVRDHDVRRLKRHRPEISFDYLDRFGRAVTLDVLACVLQGIGIVIKRRHARRTKRPRRQREDARSGPHIDDPFAVHVDLLQQLEAQARRGVMSCPEAHRGVDDDQDPVGIRGARSGIRIPDPGSRIPADRKIPRRRDGDPPDVNGLERRLAPAGPSFVLDVDG